MAQEGGKTLPVEKLRKMLKKARRRKLWEAENAAEAEAEAAQSTEEEDGEDAEDSWEDIEGNEGDVEGNNAEAEEDPGMEDAINGMARVDMERDPWEGELVDRTK